MSNDQSGSTSRPMQVHCKPGQAVRINIEIVIGEADDILEHEGGMRTKKTLVVQPDTPQEMPPIPGTGTGDPDATPRGSDHERPIELI